MFVPRIGSLNKTSFGINFKVDDIKCEIKTNINTDINNKVFEKNNKKVK